MIVIVLLQMTTMILGVEGFCFSPYLKLLDILCDIFYKVFRSFLNVIKQLFIFVEFLIHCLKKTTYITISSQYFCQNNYRNNDTHWLIIKEHSDNNF